MRKTGKWILLLLGVLCCLGLYTDVNFFQRKVDNTAPEISFQSGESDVLDISVSAPEAELLKGVTAWDKQDGDVTAGIVVEEITNMTADHTATVVYAAFDKAGNVSKAERLLHYTDYQSPRFTLSGALVFSSGTAFDIYPYVGAVDSIDGSLDDQVKATLVSGDAYITDEGVHEVTFRVTNSVKDTVYLTVPVEVFPEGTYNADLVLTDYLVYIKQGEQFDSYSYLKEFRYGSETVSLSGDAGRRSVSCNSDVNTDVPGTYSVAYTAKSGAYTAYTRLIVIVEE